MQNTDDSNIMLSQYIHDPWEGLTQACQEILEPKTQNRGPQVSREKRIKRKAEHQKKRVQHAAKSFVINKERTKGIRLIQIKVRDLNIEPSCSTAVLESDECSDDGDNVMLSAQYVVMDTVDEIMDLTETVIRKISKKLCSDSY